MISLVDYLLPSENFESLAKQLRERIFYKTQLDVVYSDITNWERMDLLYLMSDYEKSSWKKLNYIEYTWICIISELLSFGFTYNEVKSLKRHFIEGFTKADALQVLELSRGIPELEMIQESGDILRKWDEEVFNKETAKSEITVLELWIAEVVLTGEDSTIHFLKNSDLPFIPLSKSAVSGYEAKGMYADMMELLKESHVVISISQIVFKFLQTNGRKPTGLHPYILTKQEYTLLKLIRKNYKGLKTVNVKFADEIMDKIEIKNSKKVMVESRIIEHIRKGQYQTITIDTEKGKVVNFETRKK